MKNLTKTTNLACRKINFQFCGKINFRLHLHSDKLDKFYTGHTNNLKLRLERHNDGWSRSTKAGIPWKLVYKENK